MSGFETCLYGMESLFNNERNSDLLGPSTIEDLDKIDKKFHIEKIILIKMKNAFSCDVVAKDNKGYLSYHVDLEKNSKFPHHYRILNIKGQKLTSPYQWRTF